MSVTSFLQQSVPVALVCIVGMTCFLMGGALASSWQRYLHSKDAAFQRAFDAKTRIASYVLLAFLVPAIFWLLLK